MYFIQVKLTLSVHYTDDYPDTLPDVSIEAIEGDLGDDEIAGILSGLKSVVRFPAYYYPHCTSPIYRARKIWGWQ